MTKEARRIKLSLRRRICQREQITFFVDLVPFAPDTNVHLTVHRTMHASAYLSGCYIYIKRLFQVLS